MCSSAQGTLVVPFFLHWYEPPAQVKKTAALSSEPYRKPDFEQISKRESVSTAVSQFLYVVFYVSLVFSSETLSVRYHQSAARVPSRISSPGSTSTHSPRDVHPHVDEIA